MGSVSLLVTPTKVPHRNRTVVDKRATQLVLDSYFEACRAGMERPFDAALSRYLTRYPHIGRDLAGHAVAHILATGGV